MMSCKFRFTKVLWFSKSGWLEVTVTCYCIPCPGLCFAVSQAVMPSPVSELRGPNIKHHEASFLEDYNFQQASPCIRTLRDPVLNRVTLVGLCLFMCYVQANQTMCSFLISSLLQIKISDVDKHSWFIFFFYPTELIWPYRLKIGLKVYKLNLFAICVGAEQWHDAEDFHSWDCYLRTG